MNVSRILATTLTAALIGGGCTIAAPAAASMAVEHDEQIVFKSWESYRDWRSGTHEGTFAIPGVRTGITMARPAGTTDYTDPQIPHAARMAWDYQYRGAGNWPFNTAYAASFPGIDARVTRLHSLDDAERYVKAGIPVVTSLSFLASELDGANYSTSGHLFVVVGFTAEGDVIVNDPASSSNSEVRNVYKRGQLETVWLRTKRINAGGGVSGGSGGIVYLIKPWWRPWPHVPS